MWLATRGVLQPGPSTGTGRIRLRVDRQTSIQLATPKLGSNTAGYSVVESKKAMKARGVRDCIWPSGRAPRSPPKRAGAVEHDTFVAAAGPFVRS